MNKGKEQTALVTGAGRRLGRNIALSLAKSGMNIIAHYSTSRQDAEESAKVAGESGVKAWAVGADFNEPEALAGFTKKCSGIAGSIGVLVNSASIFKHGHILDSPDSDYIENLRINALAPLELCRWFSKQCKSGVIINMLDARMDDYDKDHIPYALSKQALRTITRVLSIELAPRIRVNGAACGPRYRISGKTGKHKSFADLGIRG